MPQGCAVGKGPPYGHAADKKKKGNATKRLLGQLLAYVTKIRTHFKISYLFDSKDAIFELILESNWMEIRYLRELESRINQERGLETQTLMLSRYGTVVGKRSRYTSDAASIFTCVQI